MYSWRSKNTLIYKLCFFFLLLFPFSAFAAGADDIATLLNNAHNAKTDTYCSTNVLADALKQNSGAVSEYDSEETVKAWIYDVFQSPDTLARILSCPEIIDADDYDTIHFLPIQYNFPNGRQVTINYETMPKILDQRFMLATKTELPTDDPSPNVSATDPHATWVNTDPAWYGIMVVQSGAFDDFVGPDRNNTISANYIYSNINSLYPRDLDGVCSTRSGMHAKLNNSMVHHTIFDKTAKHEDDKNNYYIAGDINLKWISFAEIGLDIAMTVVSFGGFAAATGALKGARATKIMGKLGKNMKRLLRSSDAVKDYVRTTAKMHQATKKIENLDKFADSLRSISRLEEQLGKATKGSKKYERLQRQLDAARKIHADNVAKVGKDADKISNVKDLDKLDDIKKTYGSEIKTAQEKMADLVKNDKHVAEYKKQSDALVDVGKYAKELRSIKQSHKGNIMARTWQTVKDTGKSFRAANRGGKALDRAARVARQGAKEIDKLDDITRITKDINKYEKELTKIIDSGGKYGDVAREFEMAAQYHLDEIKKISSDLTKVDAQELEKLYQAERDAVNTMKKSREQIAELEKASNRLADLEKQISNTAKNSEEYNKALSELRSLANESLYKNLSPAKQKKLTQTEERIKKLEDIAKNNRGGLSHNQSQELKKLHQERNTILNQAGKTSGNADDILKTMKDKLGKDLDAAKLSHATNAKKTIAAAKNVANSVKKLKSKFSNLKNAYKHSMGAAAVRDKLFHFTLRNSARITKAAEELTALKFVLNLAGDFYDYTRQESDMFTNGIQIKPYLLLSADSIEGQDNVVNYGMWLMWNGDSVFPADDDAAYLQAMDFAEKFHQDLVETQEETGRYSCDVDIYVVRPIIRNPGTDHQALYWLIMNDIPWSTAR